MSAFTIAFQVPNLIRSLFADSALQAAFVPVFTEQLEQRSRDEAFRVASALVFLISIALGLLTALFVLLAPVIMPLFAPGFSRSSRTSRSTSRRCCSRSCCCSGCPGWSSGS